MTDDSKPTDEQIEEVVRSVLGPQHQTLPIQVRRHRELELATIARAMWPHIVRVYTTPAPPPREEMV